MFLLLLVTDEYFMAPWPLAHGLDAVRGPSHSRKTAFKQTDIVIMPDKGLWCSTKQCGYLHAACVKASLGSLGPHHCKNDPHWWLSQWKPSCMCFFCFFRFWNNNTEQWRQTATHANLDTPIALCSTAARHPSPICCKYVVFVFKKSKEDKWKEC